MEIFAKRIKELRIECGLTQKQLADELGFPQSSIVYWEAGTKTPRAETIVALARFFGVTTDYLLGED